MLFRSGFGILCEKIKHLNILAQSSGAHAGKLTIENSGDAAIFSAGNISINGGIVSATSDNSFGIGCNSLTINGGKVDASGQEGISAIGTTINGGKVTATGGYDGIYCDGAAAAINILGGQVTATGSTAGIYTTGTITLGWTNATDFINANKYSGTVKTADDKAFNIEGGGTFATGYDVGGINDKKLTPNTANTIYDISVASGITGVEVDKTKAFEGERVAITVTPAAGKMLAALTYSDGTNTYGIGTGTNDIKQQAGDYVITMPASHITVTATFATPIAEVYDGTTLKTTTLTLSDAFQYIKTNGSGFSDSPTVKLLADTDDESANTIFYSSGNIRDALLTINLNSHTATFGDIWTQSSLTIKNGTMTSKITCSDSGGGEYTFTLDNATMTSSSFTWGYHYITLTNSSVLNVNTYSYLNGSTLDPLVLTFGDESSIMNFIECTITTMGGYLSDLGNMVDYVQPGKTLVVDGTTKNNVSLRKVWGVSLLDNLTNATVTFWDNGETAPVASSFSSASYTDANKKTNISKDGKDHYIIVHIVPDVGYWTNLSLLEVEDATATTVATNAIGLLTPDTYNTLADPTVTKDRCDGAGWYYYLLPKAHTEADAGYTTSSIVGDVVPQFDLNESDKVSQNGKVVTVSDGTSDGWSADIEFNSVSWKFDGTISMPQATKITIKKGSSEQIVLDDVTDIANQITTGDVHNAKIGENNIQLGSGLASGYNYFVNTDDEKSKFSILIPFDGSGTSVAPWKITNANELNLLAKCVNVGQYTFGGKYLEQTADIGMGSITDFLPIGVCGLSGSVPFQGNYNGAGKQISNINYTHPIPPEGFELDEVYAFVGLFGYNIGSITKVNLVGCSFSVPAGTEAIFVGGIAGLIGGPVNDCTVTGCTIKSSTDISQVGGIAGGVECAALIGPIGSRAIGTRGIPSPISGNRVRGTVNKKTTITGSLAGAIFGTLSLNTTIVINNNILSDNLYDYNVEVIQGSTTNTSYTKRGVSIISGGTSDNPEYSLTDIETNAGAMMEVYPATITLTKDNTSTATLEFSKKTPGTDVYSISDDGTTYYYAPGDNITLSATYGSIADADGIRTFNEEPTVNVNNNENISVIQSNVTLTACTFAFDMPSVSAAVNASIGQSDWFTIETKEKKWMTFYHEWKDATDAPANYTVTDGSAAANETPKTIGVKTIATINASAGSFTTTDLNGISFSGMPTMFNCEGTLPAKLKFTPNSSASTTVTSAKQFIGVKEDTKLSGNGIYVMNGVGDFILAYDTTEKLKAHKCYVDLGTAAGTRLTNAGDATGIRPTTAKLEGEGDWYSLDGRKLNGKPTRKGIYINKGVKVVIK